MTTAVVPSRWRERCPNYYRETPHLCGAFFCLKIKPEGRDAKDLKNLFVDASSFEFETQAQSTVVPPPDDAISACKGMIDSEPRRANLRVSESTMVVLRPYPQKERTERVLTKSDFTDEELAETLKDTGWLDILASLANAPLSTWERLSSCHNSIAEIGKKARAANSRLTRFDFELVANACASARLRDIVATRNGDRVHRFSALGSALKLWVTTSGEKEARGACQQD
jgi:hypothetical protein